MSGYLGDIYVFNPLLEIIYHKYEENEMIEGRPILTHMKFKNIICGVEYEMIRVIINTRIDELRNIINTIQSQTYRFVNNGDNLVANVYLTNPNPEIFRLACLFAIDIDLIIDIYREDYKKLTRSHEDCLMEVLILDLDKLKII